MRRTWTIDAGDGRQTVEIALGSFAGGLTVRVDGATVLTRNLALEAMVRRGADVPFRIGGREAVVHVRTGGLRNVLELSIDGQPFEWRSSVMLLPPRAPVGLPDVIDWAMVPAWAGMAIPLTRNAGVLAWLLMLPGCAVVHRFARVAWLPGWARIVGSIAILVAWIAPATLLAQALTGRPG